MSKLKLKDVVHYSKERIGFKDLSIKTYVSTDNLLQNKLGVTQIAKLPASTNNSPKYNNGDILISNIRPYLKKIYYARCSGGVSADVLTFTTKKGYDSKFVYYNLFQDTFFEHMMAGSKGTKMPRGDKNQILEFEIPDYTFEKQQKIASVLSALDDKIELNDKINVSLEAMAKTLYDYWFVQFDFPNPSKSSGQAGKPYKFSGGEMVYNDVLKREIPKGWEVKGLDKLYKFQYGLGNNNPDNGGEFPVYGSNGIIGYFDNFNNNDAPVIGHIGANCGSLVFAKGKHYVTYNGIMCNILDYDNRFYGYSILLTKDLKKIKRGSTQPFISYDLLYDLKFAEPVEKQLVKSFINFINPIFLKIVNLEKQNQELASLRDWLLPMLMNGQVRVAGAHEEVEGELGMVAEDSVSYNVSNDEI